MRRLHRSLTSAVSMAVALLLVFAAPINSKSIADVRLHGLFGDHMVLQQKTTVPIWGTADAGEQVTVRLQNQQATATADAQGNWRVSLENLSAGGPFEMTVEGRNRLTLNDVLVGEVWLASGQSNMAFTMSRSAKPEKNIAAADHSRLRLITVARKATDEPQSDLQADWKVCTPETVANFSAVAYYFGRHLLEHLDVPVGLISSNVGGTPAEAWTAQESLTAEPELRAILERQEKAIDDFPAAQKRHEAALEQWKQQAEKAKAEGGNPPAKPRAPVNPRTNMRRPSALYNAMIHPLVPLAIEGAIWYQGESNASRAYEYRTLFPTMIRNWREVWGRGDFPFLFVQLAPFRKIVSEPVESDWAELREAQLLTTRTVSNTAMAVITDVGAENEIHPKQKEPVGTRLALAARALAYGEDVEYSGPAYAGMQVSGNRAVLSFDHSASGLLAKGDKLSGFTIAGEDHRFVNAEARIEGDRVVVRSPQVEKPAAVRYGWANYPTGNLWTHAGLPASPFRSDDFPLTTQPK